MTTVKDEVKNEDPEKEQGTDEDQETKGTIVKDEKPLDTFITPSKGFTPTAKKIQSYTKSSKPKTAGPSLTGKEIQDIQQTILQKQQEHAQELEDKKMEFQGKIFERLFGVLDKLVDSKPEEPDESSSDEEPAAKKAKPNKGRSRGKGKR